MRKIVLLVIGILLLSGCNSKLVYDTNEEYVLKFVEALNTKDTKTLDQLLSDEAYIYYDVTHTQVALGSTKDKDSEISRLLAINTTFTDNEVLKGTSDNMAILTTLHKDDIDTKIYKSANSEYSAYEFVIEDHEITLIYAFYNNEEANEAAKNSEGQIGIRVEKKDDHLEISEVVQGSVASVMQLVAGDKIYAIDGVKVADMSDAYNEAELRLNGPKDTKVELEIERLSKGEREIVYLTRQLITDYADDEAISDEGVYYEESYEYYEGTQDKE